MSHLRFLRSENLMPFIAVRLVFSNVRYAVREAYRKSDVASRMILKFVSEKWDCSCVRNEIDLQFKSISKQYDFYIIIWYMLPTSLNRCHIRLET